MRIYLIGAICAAGAALYFCGRGVGAARCRADSAAVAMQTQQHVIKQVERINAETFNTASRDIRRILREKYTIAE